MVRKVFTVDEANSLIPLLERVFDAIQEKKEAVRRIGRQLEVLDLLWGSEVTRADNPDHYDYSRLKHEIAREISEIERIIQHEFIRRGLRFPAGGIESGLVDFPTTYDGRFVYLCWHSGEPELRFWHETDAGYRGRQEITQDQKESMGTVDDAESIDDTSLDF